jgi:phage terminase small subunit
MGNKRTSIAASTSAPVDDLDGQLNPKQAAFAREYVKDWNAAQSAIRAGYSERAAKEIGYELLTLPHVKAAIERRMAAAAAVAEVDAAMLVRELWDVATADVRELVSVHRDACRWCHGIDHRRMWTRGEYDAATAEALSVGKPVPELAGGLGYDFTREPHPECPECRGVGIERVVVADTRKLSRQAAKLYAGAQSTKDGVKALARNQHDAVIALGRYLGMWKDKNEISGAGGGPLQVQPVRPAREMTNEELQDALRASGHLQGPITEAALDRILGDTTK